MSTQQISTEDIITKISPDINKNNNDNLKDDKKLLKTTTTRTISNNITPPTSINQLPSWAFLQCKALSSDGTPLCCGVSSRNLSPGTYCIAWEIDANDNSQLWQLTSDGHLLSRLNGNYVMDFIMEDMNQINTNTWGNSTSQIWKFNDNGQIVNGTFSNMCIGMKGATDDSSFTPENGTQLILDTPTDNDNPNFQWETSPGYPLNSILTQAAVPFPTFTQGNQPAAFQDISQQLAGVNDIRSEYINTNASFSAYALQLQGIHCPSYISKELFNEIRDQLYTEFGHGEAILNLFNNYNDFHTQLFVDNSDRLDALATLVNLEEGSTESIGGSMLSFFSGLLYTILCAIPGADGAIAIAPILANVIQTAINVGVSAASAGNNIQPDPFELEYAELKTMLANNFDGLSKTVGNMEIMILQDWGMMQAVYTLINTLTGPNSLAWTPDMTGDMLSAGAPGYDNSVLQMLMPSKYQIYRWDPNNNNGVNQTTGIPDNCQWTDSNGIQYFIADINYTTVYPDPNLMDLIWNTNNVPKEDFFLSNNGWNFPISLLNNDYMIVTPMLTNQTSTGMFFQIQFGKTQTNKYNLPTFSSTFSTDFDKTWDGDGNNLEITIWDLSENYIASINVVVTDHSYEGSTVAIKNSYVKPGYYLGSPICNQGSYGYCFTPTINIQIYQNPNSS